MAWNAVTRDDVLTSISPNEKAVITAIQGVDTTIDAILGRTISLVRGAIDGGGYQLGAAGLTPDRFDSDIVSITRWRFLTSMPKLQSMQTAERKSEYEDSMKRIDSIGDRKISIEDPNGLIAPFSNWNSDNKVIGVMHPTPRPGTQFVPGTEDYANPNAQDDEV